MKSVLRWAGSKRKLLGELRAFSPRTFRRYLEPFAGSAVLFFDLLPRRATLGDLNPEVIATYRAIRDNPSDVLIFLESIPKSKNAYNELRALQPLALSDAQRAARLIFLMKACFNGVYRTNQLGLFNVPLGNKFFALPAPDLIEAASTALRDVELICGDFSDCIGSASAGDFVYLDPPYSDSTRFRGEYSYRGAFQESDQARLTRLCQELDRKGVHILLSFKECNSIRDALPGWTFKYIDVARSVAGFAHSRRRARELIAYNF